MSKKTKHVRLLSVFLAMVLVLSFVLTGCGGKKENADVPKDTKNDQVDEKPPQDDEQQDNEDAEEAKDEKPEYNKDRVFVFDGSIWEAPPAYHGNPFSPGGIGPVWDTVYEGLFKWIPTTGDKYPRLAESMDDQGSKTVVTLRQGTSWHDGKPFTSKDVLCSYHIGFMESWMIWTYLDSIEAPDDNTVIFNWKKPTIMNEFLVANDSMSAPYHIYGKWADKIAELIPKRDEKGELDDASNEELGKIRTEIQAFKPQLPIGTGPFKVKTVTASDVICEKYDKYWAADNVKFNIVRYVKIPTNEAAMAALKSANIDYAGRVIPKNVVEEILEKQPDMKMTPMPDLTTFSLIMNMEKAPFNDLEFRKALVHAINRDNVREVSLFYSDSYEKYATTGILPSIQDKWLSDEVKEKLTKYDYDVAKAEEILTSAGYKKDGSGKWLGKDGKPLSFEINVPNGWSDWVLAAENMSTQLTQFGIPTKARTVDNAQYWDVLNKGNYDMAIEFGTSGWGYAAHPWTTFNRIFTGIPRELGLIDRNNPNAKFDKKFKGINGNEVDPIQELKDLAIEMDDAKQKEIIADLAYIVNENVIFMDFLEKYQPVWRNVKRVTGYPDENDPKMYYGAIPQLMIEGELRPQ